MNYFRISLLLMLLSCLQLECIAKATDKPFLIKPLENKVFIKEKGQFAGNAKETNMHFPEPVLYGVENAEFNAYFTAHGITFQFPERKKREPAEEEIDKEEEGEREEERTIETIWHAVNLRWLNTNPSAELLPEEKVTDYYNYDSFGDDKTRYNYVPAFKKLKYLNLYPGVDAEFELSEQGGIKYKFIVQPNVVVPTIAFQCEGLENLFIDEKGNLHLKSISGELLDQFPMANSASSHTNIPVKYAIKGNTVQFQFSSENIASPEGIVIDPWITNTNFTAINRAYEMQEDAAGNIYILGNHSNFHVEKYNASGVLQWTYVTYSLFLGDIAVDNPGNVYIIGGCPTGKRQKLDTAGIQLWSLSGLREEWRLAFNYQKNVLAVGGFFDNPGPNNLAELDMNTGAISNQIVYNKETRGIATDCNGDIYSLHVPFGTGTNAIENDLRKTYANFTRADSVPSGFHFAEKEAPGIGYCPNPNSGSEIFQGSNSVIVNGPNVVIYDGISLRRFNKSVMTFIDSATVPSGGKLMCSGITADLCGNIYAGALNGIVKFDSALTYQSVIPTPGTVYDLLLGSDGELVACGKGFVGKFGSTCTPPPLVVSVPNSFCEGESVTINATGGAAPYSYLWQPGGQTTATVTNLAAGTYTYSVTDPFCHSYVDSVIVKPKPLPAFSATNPCNGYATQFTDSSTTTNGNLTSWTWDFGNGGSLNTNQNPSYTYAGVGNYNTTLIVSNSFGCKDTLTKTVQIFYSPIANFIHSYVCPGDSMHFTNLSSVNAATSIASYLWVFGDGSSSGSLQNPVHYYTLPGTYNVSLVITTVDGCTDAITLPINVYDAPASSFTFNPACAGFDSVHFTNTSTNPSMGTIASWSWDFGDGTPTNTSVWGPIHLYTFSGNYIVTLITYSSNGCTDTLKSAVTVFPAPHANFSFTDVCLNQAMNFSDLSSAPVGSITAWSWNFGNSGTTDTTQNSGYTYTNSGQYTVTLTATSNNGCIDTVSKTVFVHPLPQAQFSTANVCVGAFAQFSNSSTVLSPDFNTLWIWKFGDGGTVNNQNTSHLYAGTGTYTVQLLTVSNFGCKDSVSKVITINPNPVVYFIASDTIGCEPICANFQNISSIATGSNSQWFWDFGDGSNVTTAQNPSHCFINDSVFSPISYPVSLTVTSDNGCVSKLTKNNYITVYPMPVASFTVQPETASIMDPVISFTDLSLGAGFWNWSFGDLDSSSVSNPYPHTYADTGTYPVILTVSNQYACTDVDYHSVIIEPDFLFYVPNAFTPDDDGINDTFTGKGVFIKEFEMRIFDRWGNLIYKTVNINQPWDGKANEGKEMAQRDVYVYVIRITDIKGNKHNYRGSVTLVR